MRYSSSGHPSDRRPGVVLLIVMAMLALFASLALSFVFYADAEAVASRLNMDQLVRSQADIDAEELAGYFLQQLLYDTDNIYSAMRGWSLARSIYGYDPANLNFIPYNGVGRAALAGPDPDSSVTVGKNTFTLDNFNMVNYQYFHNPLAAPPNDRTQNVARTPEFNGKVFIGPAQLPPTPSYLLSPALTKANPSYQFVGGANAPWTAYDTNSIFLAQVDSGGNVMMPSFYRPWMGTALTTYANSLPPAKKNIAAKFAKYMSLFPDSTLTNPLYSVDPADVWNPNFQLPDAQLNPTSGITLDVQNLEYGPGGNDSKWMDLGFPVMTAPNGKRYKALFAPLIMDLTNRLHLWAHGNRNGASNMGFGPASVNLNLLPGMSVPISAAVEAKGKQIVTITTGQAHNLNINDTAIIAGAPVAAYNGSWTVTNVISPVQFQYTSTTTGMAAMKAPAPNPPLNAYGTVTNGNIYALRYGGSGGTSASVPNATPNFTAVTPLFPYDADGYDPTTGLSSSPFLFANTFSTTTTGAVPAKAGVHVVPLTTVTGTSPNGFPWALQPGMSVTIDTAAKQETVVVTAITLSPATITATFKKGHAKGVTVAYAGGNPTLIAPPQPTSGWGNFTGTEATNNPHGFNISNVYGPNYTAPLPTSNLEALVRWGGTGGPALTSDIVRRMPGIFDNRNVAANGLTMRSRNMVTTASWHMDRVFSSPFLTFDRTKAGNYELKTGNYPTLQNANQTVTYSQIGSNPAVPVIGTSPAWKSEFSADWRSNLGTLLRVDLTRALTSYKAPGTVAQALADRQKMALDIYNALVRVTGAQDPNVLAPAAVNTASTDYLAARWLAQLAVNIVDFIDNDSTPGSEAMTAFKWFNGTKAAKGVKANLAEYVFGTELPALVLNEAYAQQENSPTGPINLWAELLNPLQNSTASAVLQPSGGGQNYYQIEVYNSPPTGGIGTYLTGNNGAGPVGATLTTVTNWIPTGASASTAKIMTQVNPVNGGAAIPTTKTINISAETANPPGAKMGPGTTVTIHAPAHGLVKTDVGKAVTITGVTGAKPMHNPIVGYDGTYIITAVPNANTFQYQASVAGLPPGGSFPAGAATAVYETNANDGYYVLGPAGATYNAPNRVPNLPATLATPQMSITNIPVATIAPVNKKNPALDGLREAGATVTVNTTLPLPASFYVGSQIKINSPPPTNPLYNGTFTILTINPARTSFTYTDTNGKATKLAPGGGGTVTLVVQNVSMLLRRLADPNQAFNATTNPFITVDYIDNVPVNAGVPSGNSSVGRTQPYNAATLNPQTAAGTPKTTFFGKNSGSNASFDVLVHLDRPPVNPLELIFVSGYRPHLLTHQFIANGATHQHYAPWNPYVLNASTGKSMADPSALIHRALDQMSTNYMAGLYAGGRFPGNINLNTLMDPEIFNALCDAPAANSPQHAYAWFTQTDVTNVWTALTKSTNVGPVYAAAPAYDPTIPVPVTVPATPQPNPPLKSFSAATTVGTAGTSLGDTLFRNNSTGTPLFAVKSGATATTPASHPYVQASLLQKIYNNITTTSNVFAVWWTVGYFEVVDESVQPPRLGQEIGRSQNSNIRHRFFAIVDRSGMQIGSTSISTAIAKSTTAQTVTFNAAAASNMTGYAGPWTNQQSYAISNIVTDAGQAFVCIKQNINQAPLSKKGALNGKYWQPLIQPGMLLEIVDTNPANNPNNVNNTEVVSVLSTAGSTFTAVFTKNHVINATTPAIPVIIRGNPGPQANYSPHKDTNVVLHLSVIK